MWQSDESNIIGADKEDIGNIIERKDSEVQAKAFSLLIRNMTEKENGNSALKLQDMSLFTHKTTRGNWQMENIESKISAACDDFYASEEYLFKDVPELIDNSISNHEDVYYSTKASEFTDMDQRRKSENSQPCSFKNLVPEKIELQSKRTLRCRKDLNEGKMNILIQPKTFPLEGDSSLKIQRGKWWVKDVSAVHEIPYVCILKLPDFNQLISGRYAYLHISITNPKDFDVELVFNGFATEHDDTDPKNHSGRQINELLEASTNYGRSAQFLSGHSSLPLLIGAYEDELLKDAADEETDEEQISSLASASEDGNKPVRLPPWTYRVSSNIAYVQIPIKLSTQLNDTVVDKMRRVVAIAREQTEASPLASDTSVLEEGDCNLELHLQAQMQVLTSSSSRRDNDGSSYVDLPMRLVWAVSSLM